MQIQERKIRIEEVAKNYKNHAEEGVSGFDGRLDIRPPYRREFVYKK